MNALSKIEVKATVKSFNNRNGFGFLVTSDERVDGDIFCNLKKFRRLGLKGVPVGLDCVASIHKRDRGWKAVRIESVSFENVKEVA